MAFIGQLLILALTVYFWIIIASVVISWLIAFGVMNTRNPQAANILKLLHKVTEPVYRPIRKVIPSIGGIDLSPIVVIFGIQILQHIIARLFYHPGYYGGWGWF